ncbi:WD40 repeat-like protein [Exidia glandulosa HHB12029]|uniref:WD40 repeat-like protein n=1 Tax=Exidia glandulosa HHB12029 TaxID=1314781 RepID=A0A165IUN3_EXIGL|nr:WD40 repeat-like protein [Exidia glandulosa HHB12029]
MSHSLATMQDLTANVVVNFDRKVASGGYGDVYKGRLIRGVDGFSGDVAVKVTRFISVNVPEKAMKGIKHELAIWKRQRHPYILPLIGVYLRRGIPCAVSPWCYSGTILQYMKSARRGHEAELDAPVTKCDFDLLRLHCLEIRLLSQVVAGLAYLHAHNLSHGDIKASNVLVKGGVAQLGDFGFSVFLADHSGNTSSHLGTARWFAPESLQEHAHRTREADIWALGCVILEVRTLLVPYHRVADTAVPLAILKDRPFERPEDIHPSLWSMAEACWSRSRKARIVSSNLASRIETTLKYVTLLLEALGALPDVCLVDLEYPNSNSTARSSLASVISKGDNTDLTLAVATARNALRALEVLGKRYPPATLQPTIRLIALKSKQLSVQLMGQLSSLSPLRHAEAVYSVAFLPDGFHIVSSSRDMALRIWDIRTMKTVISPLKGHTDSVRSVAVHGSRIASCSFDGTFRVWNAESGKKILGPITAHSSKRMRCIAYSKDGTRIATAGDDNRAAVWDANTGFQLREMIGHTTRVMCVAFSEDGTRLISGSQGNTIRIWDVASGECIGEPLTGHTDWVTSVCFSPDDKRIFSSSYDGTIRIWHAETRALIVEPLQVACEVLCMALSPDGKHLASGSCGGGMAVWDAETGNASQAPFKYHTKHVWGVAFSKDGHMIASASADKTVALWTATDYWKRYELHDHINGHNFFEALMTNIPHALTNEDIVALSSLTSSEYGREKLCSFHAEAGFPDSRPIALRLLASLSIQLVHGYSSTAPLPSAVDAARAVITTIQALDLRLLPPDLRPVAHALATHDKDASNELMAKLGSVDLRPPLRGHTDDVCSVAFLTDGRRLVSSSVDCTLRIWDVETGKTTGGPLKGHTDSARCVAVYGSRIASCSYDGTFRVWDADSGALVLGPITAHDGEWLNWIAYSREGTHIATAGYDKRVAIWDADTGAQLRAMVGHTAPVMCVAFSEDATRLVSGSQDHTIRIWDVASGECIGEPLARHTRWIHAVCFGPGDKRIFSSSEDSTICIWDTQTSTLIFEPLQINHKVLSMALSPDGKRLVAGSQSGKIVMWDAETGAAISTPFRDHGAEVWGVAFSLNGHKIASASRDGTIGLWDATDHWKRYDIDDEDVQKDDD